MNLFKLHRHHWKIALVLGIAALILRLAFSLLTVNPDEIFTMGDSPYYWALGQEIAAGSGALSSTWAPLYPYFLGAIFFTLGESLTPVLIVQSIVSAVSVSLFYLAAVRLLGDVKGLLAGLIYTVLPWNLFYTKQILTETVYIPLFVLVLAVLIIPKREMFDRFYYWIGLGIAIGLVTLARREGIQYAGMAVAFITLLRFGFNFRLLIKGALISGIFFALMLTPLIISNYREYGQFVFSTTTGVAMMDGNNPNCNSFYCPDLPEEWDAQLEGLNELERDAKGTELATNWIKNNPGDFARLIPIKLGATWGFVNDLRSDVADVVLLVLCLLGVVQLRRRDPNWLAIALLAFTPILLVTANAIVFHGFWRFRAIAYPGLVFLAVYGIQENWLLALIPLRFRGVLGLTPPEAQSDIVESSVG